MQVQNCATEKLLNTANYLISFIYRYEKRDSFQFLLDIHIYALLTYSASKVSIS